MKGRSNTAVNRTTSNPNVGRCNNLWSGGVAWVAAAAAAVDCHPPFHETALQLVSGSNCACLVVEVIDQCSYLTHRANYL